MKGFCVRCGAELKDTDRICPNCGMPVEEDAADTEKNEKVADLEDTAEIPSIEETQITEQPDPEDEKIYVVEKKPSIISTIFYILLLLFLLGAAAFAYCYFQHPDYLDTAFGYIGVKTNFAREIEIEGTYNSSSRSTPTPTITVSPEATAKS